MYALDHALIATPIGGVRIEGGDCVTAIAIGADGTPSRGASDAVRAAAEQLEQYFAGERCAFDLALMPARTPRGDILRTGIIDVPYGETARYGDVARAIASGARAVGQACRMNPFPIVVPCHRIVGGAGYYSAGDGLPTKNWLLAHEQHYRRTSIWVK